MAKTDKFRQLAQALLGEEGDVDEAVEHLYTNEAGVSIYAPPTSGDPDPSEDGSTAAEDEVEASTAESSAEDESEDEAAAAAPEQEAEAAKPTPQARQIARQIGSQGGRSPRASNKLTPEQIRDMSDDEFDRKLAEMAGVGGN